MLAGIPAMAGFLNLDGDFVGTDEELVVVVDDEDDCEDDGTVVELDDVAEEETVEVNEADDSDPV